MDVYAAHPASHLPILLRASWVRYLVVRIVSVHKVLQDGTAFPYIKVMTVLVFIRNGGNAAVRVDLEEPRLFLFMGEERDLPDLSNPIESIFCLWCKTSSLRRTLYFKPSSSRAMDTLRGLGVPSQYKVMFSLSLMLTMCRGRWCRYL